MRIVRHLLRKELLQSEEENMNAIPRKQRAMVRKGIKNELISEIDTNVDRFFALYSDNVHRHGTPALSKRYFRALFETFGADCEILTVSTPDGKPLSSVLSFYFRDEVLPYYAGDDLAARDLAANDFKYWELMRHGLGRGARALPTGATGLNGEGSSTRPSPPWTAHPCAGQSPADIAGCSRLWRLPSLSVKDT